MNVRRPYSRRRASHPLCAPDVLNAAEIIAWAKGQGFKTTRLMEQFGEARVLLIASNMLKWRHDEMVDRGASWDHPEYQAHITISYDPDSPDLSTVEPYQGEIVLGPEIFEVVKED